MQSLIIFNWIESNSFLGQEGGKLRLHGCLPQLLESVPASAFESEDLARALVRRAWRHAEVRVPRSGQHARALPRPLPGPKSSHCKYLFSE